MSSPPTPSMPSHWLPDVERRGIGDMVLCVNHIALIVADVGRSTAFYTDVLGLQQIQRPNFDRHGAWLTAGNMEIHLIKGVPLVHTGENLIVSHIALDVKDPEEAFRRLRKLQVPFEVNVSVPKGEGKAESEGGGRDNALSQAFIRDPDGYYLEVCNYNVLTEFALGKAGSMAVEEEDETGASTTKEEQQGPSSPSASLYCMAKMLVLAHRAKKRYRQRKILSAWSNGRKVSLARKNAITAVTTTSNAPTTANISGEPKTAKDESISRQVEVDEVILANLEKRMQVYGDICQSFELFELEERLLDAGNDAPRAILLMLEQILNGRKRLFQPPAYYVECNLTNRRNSSGLISGVPAAEQSYRLAKIEPSRRGSRVTSFLTAGLKSIIVGSNASFRHWGVDSSRSLGRDGRRASSRMSSGSVRNMMSPSTSKEFTSTRRMSSSRNGSGDTSLSFQSSGEDFSNSLASADRNKNNTSGRGSQLYRMSDIAEKDADLLPAENTDSVHSAEKGQHTGKTKKKKQGLKKLFKKPHLSGLNPFSKKQGRPQWSPAA